MTSLDRPTSAAPHASGAGWVSRQLDAMPVGRVHRLVVVAVGLGLFFDIYEIFLSGSISVALKGFAVSATQTKILLASAFLGMFVGSALLGGLADRLGRRRAFLFNLVWYSVWSVVAAFAPNAWFLVAARFLAGVGVGAEYPVADSYLSDVLPKDKRGRLASWAYTLSFVAVPVVGFLALYLNVHELAGIAGWRWLLALGGVGALVVLWLRRDLPESPRWLEARGRHEEARAALQVFADGAGVTLEPEEGPEGGAEVRAEGARPGAPGTTSSGAPDARGLALLRRTPYTRRFVMLVLFHLLQTFGYYGFGTLAATVLVARGYSVTSSLLFTALSFLGYPLGAWASIPLIKVFERKHLVIVSLVLLAGFGLLFATSSSPALIVVFGFLTTSVSNVFSNVYHVYQAEIFPTQVRATAVGLTYALSRLSTGLLPFVLLPVLDSHGSGAMFGIVAGALLVVMLSVATLGPLTRGRSVEEINPVAA